MTNTKARWTNTDWNILRRMRFEGASWDEVSQKLRRTKAACIEYARFRELTHQKSPRPQGQLCWECGRSTGATLGGVKCPWAGRLEPVKGWDAVPVKYTSYNGGAGTDRTYRVISCPLFTEEQPAAKDIDESTAIDLFAEVVKGMVEDFKMSEALMYSNDEYSKRRAAAQDFLWYDEWFGDTKAGVIARKMLQDYEWAKEVAGGLR